MPSSASGHTALVQEQHQIRDQQHMSENPIVRSIRQALKPYHNNDAAQREEEQIAGNAGRRKEMQRFEQQGDTSLQREAARITVSKVRETETEMAAPTCRECQSQRA